MNRPRLLPLVHATERMVGNSLAITALRAQIRHLASFDAVGNPYVPTVLLYGETGTGKGLVARIIHDSGPRAQGPFLDVNCAAIPETLLEAEVFGFAAGAFTDAKQAKLGLLEAASRGTLVLDEIDAVPLPLQGKLLTAIEEKRVRRLGAVAAHTVDVKLIAATQADLSRRVAEGRFRSDLYHRLAVVVLEVPPLRARGEDAVVLAQHFLRHYAEAHRLSPKRLSPAAAEWLERYPWPGNVRELSHLMERATLLSQEAIIDPDTLERLCLPQPQLAACADTGTARDGGTPGDEAAQIRQALLQTRGNVVRAARLLGLNRSALRHRMARYGIVRPSEKELAMPPADFATDPTSHPAHSPSKGQGRPLVPSPGWGERGGEGASGYRDDRRPASTSEEAPTQAHGWEQKPVAVLAIEVTWPAATDHEASRYEPWTVTAHWEQAIVEKVQGFGGVVLRRSPSLLTVTFGVPQTLEQLPQRAVQAALALRHLVAEAPREPCPELRLTVHWGQLLMDVQALDPTEQVLAIGETLALPVRLLGQATSGEILVSPAVIGHAFSISLLMRVVAQPEAELRQQLSHLQAAEFLYERPTWPELQYTFKHVLTQDVAYASVPSERRRMLHERTAQVIEAHFGHRLEERYSELAHHYSHSGNMEKAVVYLYLAGQQAVQRSAYAEAISLLTTGLELLQTLPDTPERARQELELLLVLGPALMANKGFTAPEVEQVYARARLLCEQVGDTPALFRVLQGLRTIANQRGEFQADRELGEQLLSLAQNLQDPALLLAAHRALGSALFSLGELTLTRMHFEQGLALYERYQQSSLAVLYGQHPGVGCLRYLARILWLLGYPDQALQRIQEALTLAQTLAHPQSLAEALCHMAHIYRLRREVPQTLQWAEAGMVHATEQGFPVWLSIGVMLQGWALAIQSRGAQGMTQMLEVLAAVQAEGRVQGQPSLLAWLAEGYLELGQAEEGLRMIAEALKVVHTAGERFYEAELYRLRGELLLRQAIPAVQEADACFRQALEVACHQQAKSLELRAAMSLSRLWQGQERRGEARKVLAPIYGWFSEGFNTADLQEAKALLEALA